MEIETEMEVLADSSLVLAIWFAVRETESPGRAWFRSRREAARLLRGE
jgi:hypothetical protein